MLLSLVSLYGQAQEVTYIHERDIMNQFTTMETGAGVLSPAWYYNSLHKNYQRDANLRNKLAYRTDVMRSEERSVGKECRSRWMPYPQSWPRGPSHL